MAAGQIIGLTRNKWGPQLKSINRLIVLICLAYTSNAIALSAADQQHLFDRLSFGQSAHPELDLSNKNRSEAVSLLLDSIDSTISVEPPGWIAYTLGPVDKDLPLSKEAFRKYSNNRNKIRRTHKKELKAWWLRQIHESESPVAERLVLFWQNYFTTQIQPLPTASMSWDQQLTLRRHVAVNYRALLRDMNKDPALLWFLDNHLNSKKSPNENYARELLELYSLGEGHFSEQDVKELARVMTGAGVDRKTWQYKFEPGRHDMDEKSIFSSTGKLRPSDVTDIILMQDRAKKYLVERLWLEFVSLALDGKAIDDLSNTFEAAGYELRPLLHALFNHPRFWDKKNRLTLYKSPIELVISTHLKLDLPILDHNRVVDDLAAMGQELFQPPTVGGWPVGQKWMDSTRLAKRHQYLLDLDQAFAKDSELEFQLK